MVGGARETTRDWVELHRHFSQRHIVWGERGWETIKINITINFALIAATFTIIGVIYENLPQDHPPPFTYLLLLLSPIIIPIFLIWINDITSKNFERECRRMYRNLTILIKIEEKMGLYDERSEDRNLLKDDKYFVPDDFLICHRTTKDFIDAQMETEDRAFKRLSPLFTVFQYMSIVLIALNISIVIFSSSLF